VFGIGFRVVSEMENILHLARMMFFNTVNVALELKLSLYMMFLQCLANKCAM